MKKILFVLLVVTCISCRKDRSEATMNCVEFRQSILTNNETQVKKEIENLCNDLFPVVTTSDEWGHMENFSKLTQRISQNCRISAVVVCYACIKTLPPQTEILISFDNNGVLVKKTLDISTSSKSRLSFLAMHD